MNMNIAEAGAFAAGVLSGWLLRRRAGPRMRTALDVLSFAFLALLIILWAT